MILLDTHALIWAVHGDQRLGTGAATAIDEAQRSDRLGVCAITLWEIALLVQRGRLRLALDVGEWLDAAWAQSAWPFYPSSPP